MTARHPREQQLLISALGTNGTMLSQLLTRTCQENRCSITSCRLTHHGQHSSMILQAGGSWDALARLETALNSLADHQELSLSFTRTFPDEPVSAGLPYIAYVNALQQPDTLAHLCQFFHERGIPISTIVYDSQPAPQSDTRLTQATLQVELPVDTQINWLREQFLEFADILNLDAMLEPWRPHHP